MKILMIASGGTTCSGLIDGCRRLSPDVSQSTLVGNFYNTPKYASLTGGIFENSHFEPKTLSENMTPDKLWHLVNHIRSFDLSCYNGVIVLHGTDTLAYTASMLAVVMSDAPVPVMLVSGDAPPDMETSNANANFAKAYDLIAEGIAPNVYVPYRNPGEEVKVHLASRIMQSPSFTSAFYSAKSTALAELDAISRARKSIVTEISGLDSSVLIIEPYVGLDYSRISLDNIKAVAHGSYHSGTFCAEGGKYSLTEFAKRCEKAGIPVFVAPCTLGEEQYESVMDAMKDGSLNAVNMTLEMLYTKLVLGVSVGHIGEELKDFVKTCCNSELF